jgi:predicted flap endonuclease-1-like 5' DNA nuclease
MLSISQRSTGAVDIVGLIVGALLGAAMGAGAGWWVWGRSRRTLSNQVVNMYKRLTAADIERQRLKEELAAVADARQSVDIDLREAVTSNGPPAHDMSVVLEELETQPDLELVKGIGPKIAVLLAGEGITSLDRLANMTDSALYHLSIRLPTVAERIEKEGWREQARELLSPSRSHAK